MPLVLSSWSANDTAHKLVVVTREACSMSSSMEATLVPGFAEPYLLS